MLQRGLKADRAATRGQRLTQEAEDLTVIDQPHHVEHVAVLRDGDRHELAADVPSGARSSIGSWPCPRTRRSRARRGDARSGSSRPARCCRPSSTGRRPRTACCTVLIDFGVAREHDDAEPRRELRARGGVRNLAGAFAGASRGADAPNFGFSTDSRARNAWRLSCALRAGRPPHRVGLHDDLERVGGRELGSAAPARAPRAPASPRARSSRAVASARTAWSGSGTPRSR